MDSIPTAPTNHPFSQQQLSDLSRRQKGGNKSLKGGTNGSNVRIPAMLCESRSLNIRYMSERRQCVASFPRTRFWIVFELPTRTKPLARRTLRVGRAEKLG